MTRTQSPEIESNDNRRADAEKLDSLAWAKQATAGAYGEAQMRVEPGMCSVPLLPSYGIYLFCTDGDKQRFVRLFRQVWAKLPEPARLCLLGRWRKKQQHLAGLVGEIAQPKCGFFLDLAWMDTHCDGQARDVIAYELARTLVSREEHPETPNEIDWILGSWGFPSAGKGACCRKEPAGD
jgi:hypothetical protein